MGVEPTAGATPSITFRHEDTKLPLITCSACMRDGITPVLDRQLQDKGLLASMSLRVRQAIADGLPAGNSSADAVARRLNTSKRSLQRWLADEGTSFQEILSAVRSDLARDYLDQDGISVPEIAHLLGFRDTSSFFRAFQGWLGLTPGEYRMMRARAPQDRPLDDPH